MEEKKIFAIHLRVSTGMQAEDGESMDMQETLAKEAIKKEGGILYKVYSEPAVSASKTKLSDRTELMECLKDAQSGLFNHLIVYRRDRLARNTGDSIAIREILKRSGIKVIFTATGESDMDFNDPYAVLMENVRASLDEIESVQTSIRVSDNMINKAKRGEWTGGIAPYGYEAVETNLVPVESELPVIKEIENLYLQGFGFTAIANWLNGLEVRGLGKRETPAKRTAQRKGEKSHFTKGIIRGILLNPTYSGYMAYSTKKGKTQAKGEIISVKSKHIIPIRSEETQQRINAILDKKIKFVEAPIKYNTPFLLTGILRCQSCGEKYGSRTTQWSNGKRYSYYYCEGRNSGKKARACTSKQYKKDVLEDFVLGEAKKAITHLIESDIYGSVQEGLKSNEVEKGSRLKEIDALIERAESDLMAIKRLLYELKTDSPAYELLRDEYMKDQTKLLLKINELKKTKIEVEHELEEQSKATLDVQSIIDELKMFNEAIDNAPLHLKKQMLASIFNVIEISIDGVFNFVPSFIAQPNNGVFHKHGEEVISFISKGTLGTPKEPQHIKLNLTQNAYSVGFFKWLDDLRSFVKDTFYDYVMAINPMLKKSSYFLECTNYSYNTYFRLKNKQAVPKYETMEDLLHLSGKTVEEYIAYVNESLVCTKNIMKVLAERRMY